MFPPAIKEVTAPIKVSPVLNRRRNRVSLANYGQQAMQQCLWDLPPLRRTYCYQARQSEILLHQPIPYKVTGVSALSFLGLQGSLQDGEAFL